MSRNLKRDSMIKKTAPFFSTFIHLSFSICWSLHLYLCPSPNPLYIVLPPNFSLFLFLSPSIYLSLSSISHEVHNNCHKKSICQYNDADDTLLLFSFLFPLSLFQLSLSHLHCLPLALLSFYLSLSTSSVSLPLLIYLCLCLISTSLYLCLSIPHFYCVNLFLLCRVWVDSRTVNVIASACTSTMNRVVVAALQFFLGSLIILSGRQREKCTY